MNQIYEINLEQSKNFVEVKQELSAKQTKKIKKITNRAEACASNILNLSKDYTPNQTQVVRHYHHHDSWYWRSYGCGLGDTHNHYHNHSPSVDSTSKSTDCFSSDKKKKKNSEVGVAVLGTALLALGYSFYSAAKISAQKIATTTAQKKILKNLKQIEEVKEKPPLLKNLNKVVKKESQIIDRISGRLTRESIGTALLGAAGMVGLGSYIGQDWQLAYAAGALGTAAIGTWMVSWYKNQSEEVCNQQDARAILEKTQILKKAIF